MDTISYLMGHKAGEKAGEAAGLSKAVLVKKNITPDSSTKITINAADGEDLSQYNYVSITLRVKNTSTSVDVSDYSAADVIVGARYAFAGGNLYCAPTVLHNASYVQSRNVVQLSGGSFSASKIELELPSSDVFASDDNARYWVILMYVDSPLAKLG